MRRGSIVAVLALTATTVFAQRENPAETPTTETATLPAATIMPAPFPIEVTADVAGLAIAAQAGYTGVDAYLKLKNLSDTAVRCEAVFKNGPESSKRVKHINPAESAMLIGGTKRVIVALRIAVTCRSVP